MELKYCWFRRLGSNFTRGSHRRWCFIKKGVLKNLAIFIGKRLCQSLFLSCRSGSHQSWKVLDSPKIWRESWQVLEFSWYFEIFWNLLKYFGKVLEKSWNFFVVKQSKREISKLTPTFFGLSLYESSRSLTNCFDFHLRYIGCSNVYIQGVIQIFLGGNITKKCDHDCDQALIKSNWGSV